MRMMKLFCNDWSPYSVGRGWGDESRVGLLYDGSDYRDEIRSSADSNTVLESLFEFMNGFECVSGKQAHRHLGKLSSAHQAQKQQ